MGARWGIQVRSIDGGSPEGKIALSIPTSFLGQLGSKPLITPCSAAVNVCMTIQRVGLTFTGRGWEPGVGATKNLTPLQYLVQNRATRFNLKGQGWLPDTSSEAND